VKLLAIAFNHDSNAATNDALNIRRDGDEFVAVPEWQQGQQTPSLAAYSINDTRGRTITIRARFAAPEHAVRSVQVRAMPAPPPSVLSLGVAPLQATSINGLWTYHAGALGRVGAREVAFDANGDSGFVAFDLLDPLFHHRGVGTFQVAWAWQFRLRPGAPWLPLVTTQHRVFSLLATPTAPWEQQPHGEFNTQLPWASVLDWAALWATGAHDEVTAASAITFGVFAQGGWRITYGCQFSAPSNYSFPAFDCTRFLERLAGLPGHGVFVNCSDCATFTSTFANAVGCDLWQSQMFNEFQAFPVNPARLIGAPFPGVVCGTGVFLYHEVAWTGACGVHEAVYDACLEGLVTLAPLGPPISMLPVNITFGNPGAGGYRDVLVNPAGRWLCTPHPEERQRRFVY
jgi:hypothetical protein